MPIPSEQLDKVIHAAAALNGLHIATEHRAGVLRYLALAAGMADLVYALPLSPADESGAVFRPVVPETDV